MPRASGQYSRRSEEELEAIEAAGVAHEVVTIGTHMFSIVPEFCQIYPRIDYLCINPSALRYYAKHIEWYIWQANRCQIAQIEGIMRDSHLCRGIEPEELVDLAERQFDHTRFSAFENSRTPASGYSLSC